MDTKKVRLRDRLAAQHSPISHKLSTKQWRNAVDLHHLPEGTHSLAPRPGSLVRLTSQIGARRRIRTGTVEGLSFVPLHWATGALVPTVGFAPTLCAF